MIMSNSSSNRGETNDASEKQNGPDETTPLTSEAPKRSLQSAIITCIICTIMILLSVLLINVNKFIMGMNRFPYSMPLIVFQMVLCTLLSGSLFACKPSSFPALTDPATKIHVDVKFITTMFLPIAVFFSVGLVLGNAAYSHLGLAFIQMLKECNIVCVYILSVITRSEMLSMRSIQVIMLSIVGMSLTIHGERRFTLIGFLLQIGAVVCESLRITFQSMLLKGRKFDPLSYVLISSPISGMIVLSSALLSMLVPNKSGGFALPHVYEVVHWAPWLILSGVVAFCLNISIAAVMYRVGGMSYLICQLVKDVAAVVIGIFLLHEAVSGIQFIGFGLQLLAVLSWSLLKSFPEIFEEKGLIHGLVACGRLLIWPSEVETLQASPKSKV